MQRVGGMEVKRARAGAGHGRGNLLRDYSRLAHPQNHDLAFASSQQLHNLPDFIAVEPRRRLRDGLRLQTKKALDFGKVVFVSHSLPLIYDQTRLLQVHAVRARLRHTNTGTEADGAAAQRERCNSVIVQTIFR